MAKLVTVSPDLYALDCAADGEHFAQVPIAGRPGIRFRAGITGRAMLAHGGHLLHQTGVAGSLRPRADDAVLATHECLAGAERRVEGEVLQRYLAFAGEDYAVAVQLLGH